MDRLEQLLDDPPPPILGEPIRRRRSVAARQREKGLPAAAHARPHERRRQYEGRYRAPDWRRVSDGLLRKEKEMVRTPGMAVRADGGVDLLQGDLGFARRAGLVEADVDVRVRRHHAVQRAREILAFRCEVRWRSRQERLHHQTQHKWDVIR